MVESCVVTVKLCSTLQSVHLTEPKTSQPSATPDLALSSTLCGRLPVAVAGNATEATGKPTRAPGTVSVPSAPYWVPDR